MLISLTGGFLFIANLKTASSSIERMLGPVSDIAIRHTHIGKHQPLEGIERRYAWLFKQVPIDSLVVFGVMRDPVDYLISLYNSHQKPAFAGGPISTVGVDFDRFVDEWSIKSWQADLQKRMFTRRGEIGIDVLIDFAELAPQLQTLQQHLGLDAAMVHVNESPNIIARSDVSPRARALIDDRYAPDFAFHRQYAGRVRTPDGWLPISAAALAAMPGKRRDGL